MTVTHDRFELHRKGRLLVMRAHGHWDTNIAEDFAFNYMKAVKALGQGKWGCFFDLRRWGTADQGIEAILSDLADWRAPQGRGEMGFLFGFLGVMRMKVDWIIENSNIRYQFFDDFLQARDWAQALPFPLESSVESVIPQTPAVC